MSNPPPTERPTTETTTEVERIPCPPAVGVSRDAGVAVRPVVRRCLEYRLPLDGADAVLFLPRDLTPFEASRIVAMVRAIAPAPRSADVSR